MLPRLLILAVLLGVAFAVDKVATITGEDSFQKLVKENNNVVVEFYAPWCGHCKKLAPEYEKAAGILRTMGENVVLAKCDATDEKNKALAEKFGVRGYPTLKVFKAHDAENPVDYNGPRETRGIVDYVINMIGPASGRLDTKRDVEKFLATQAVIAKAFGVFPSAESEDFKAFEAAADGLREDVKCAHSFDVEHVELCEGGKCENKSKIFVKIEEDDEDVKEYDGEMKVDDIKEWVARAVAPKLVELGSSARHTKALKTIFGSDSPRLFGFVPMDADKLKDIRAALIAANDEDHDLNVIFVDPKTNPKAVNYFGIVATDTPTVVLHRQTDGKRFIATIAEGKDVKKFLEDYKADKIEPTIKSQDIPETNDGPVTVVVGKTFDDVVLGSGKNVMIEFYAPWCGHCKKLEPIYDEVGEHFKDDPTVVIAKMDSTANDVPDNRFVVKGYPTLKFFTAAGEIKDYPGKRTKEAIVEFINEHRISMEVHEESDEEEQPSLDEHHEDDAEYNEEEYEGGDEVLAEEADEEDEYLDEDDDGRGGDTKDEL